MILQSPGATREGQIPEKCPCKGKNLGPPPVVRDVPPAAGGRTGHVGLHSTGSGAYGDGARVAIPCNSLYAGVSRYAAGIAAKCSSMVAGSPCSRADRASA